jgi:hypothetical protein
MEILQQVFPLNFGGMLEYFHYTLLVCWSIYIILWWYGGVFPLNFGGMVKFNGNTPPYQQSLMEILHHTNKV